MSNFKDKKILVAGAGLVGSLLGLRLLQKGFNIEIFETREDMRLHPMSAGRSINLALSHRGIEGLKRVGMDQQILSHAVTMKGRMIHSLSEELLFQPYSLREREHIHSISRRTLNVMLMDALEEYGVKINFNKRLKHFNPELNTFTFTNAQGHESEYKDCILIATDGANSAARKNMLERSSELRMNFTQKFQPYGYKELTIPPGPGQNFKIEKNALHIWPRGHFMMIALPNPDGTFTATLFLPFSGEESFSQLTNEEAVHNFYKKHFPDSLDLLPQLQTEFFENPTGQLYSIKCSPWHYNDQLLLMGDAAHAIIPFYGQGMNCGFEDVVVFDDLLNQYTDTSELFKQFEQSRKINADSISDLAEDNFEEMREKVSDKIFQRKRKLEAQLEEKFPEYYSKYALVTFRPDISYHQAMNQGRKQDEYLLNLCKDQMEFNEIELTDIFNTLRQFS